MDACSGCRGTYLFRIADGVLLRGYALATGRCDAQSNLMVLIPGAMHVTHVKENQRGDQTFFSCYFGFLCLDPKGFP